MRSDYALYVVAIICFIIAAYTATTNIEIQLYVYAIAVLGIIFIGLGYMAKSKNTTVPQAAPTPPLSPPELQSKQTKQLKTETIEEPKETLKKKARKKKTTRRRKKKT